MFNRHLLETIWKLYDTHPQIASHALIKIRPAIQDIDYRFAEEFRDFAIVVEVTFKEIGCKMCRCNPKYPRSQTCNTYDELKIFKSGNATVSACEPICYHINSNMFGSLEHAETPFMNWNYSTKSCLFQSLQFNTWGIDDSTRDETFRSYVTNIGTGFDPKVYTDENGYTVDSFTINKFYCDELGMNFSNGQCVQTKAHTFFEYVVSDTLYRFGDILKNIIVSAKTPFNVGSPDVGTPDKESIPNYLKSVEKWQNNIDFKFKRVSPFVKLSELGFTEDNWTTHIWTNEILNEDNLYGKLTIPSQIYGVSMFYNKNVDKVADRLNKLDHTGFRYIHPDADFVSLGRRQMAMNTPVISKTRSNTTGTTNINITMNGGNSLGSQAISSKQSDQQKNFENTSSTKLGTALLDDETHSRLQLPNIDNIDFRQLLDSIFSEQVTISLVSSGIFNTATKELARLLVTINNKIIPKLCNVIITQLRKANLKVFQMVVKQIVIRHIAVNLVQLSARAAISLVQAGSKALSGVGIVLIIFNVLDLLFLFKDPFNRNQYIETKSIERMALNILDGNEKIFGRRQLELTPYILQQLFWRLPHNNLKISKNTNFFGSIKTVDEINKSIQNQFTFNDNSNSINTQNGEEQSSTMDNINIDFFNQIINEPIAFELFLNTHYMLSLKTNSDGDKINWSNNDNTYNNETDNTEKKNAHYFNFGENKQIVQDIFEELLINNMQTSIEFENYIGTALKRKKNCRIFTYVGCFMFLLSLILILLKVSVLLIVFILITCFSSTAMAYYTIFAK